jgi:hypothetical protein
VDVVVALVDSFFEGHGGWVGWLITLGGREGVGDLGEGGECE